MRPRLATLVLFVVVAATAGAGGVAAARRPPEPSVTLTRAALPPAPEREPAPPPPVPGHGSAALDPGLSPPPGPVAMAGCPVPPSARRPSSSVQPWRPPRLVPESALPEPSAPPPPVADVAPVRGKGMWLWKYFQSEGGNADAIVDKAVAAGLRQIWVRVGDSRDGFYAADVLSELVPRAHRRNLAVIGWGFPYLYDPVADARWSAEVLGWRGPGGEALDGFSPDIETGGEGVMLSARRAQVYLGLVRQAAGSRLVVATVFWPSEKIWGRYPYTAIAPYVDAFAAMVYWGCHEPGEAAARTLQRLSPLRPVHVIGQAYNQAPEGGRQVTPSGEETLRFLDVARRGGALGGSFWVWQEIGQEQWRALSGFRWP